MEQPCTKFGVNEIGRFSDVCCYKFIEINELEKLFLALDTGVFLICPITNEVTTVSRDENSIKNYTGCCYRNSIVYVADIEGLLSKITFEVNFTFGAFWAFWRV